MSFPDDATASLDLPLWPLGVRVCTVCRLLQVDPTDAPWEVADPTLDGLADASASLRDERRRTVEAALESSRIQPPDVVFEMASHGNHLTAVFASHGIRTVVLEPDGDRVERLRAAGLQVEATSFDPVGAARVVAARGRARLVMDDYLLSHHADLDAAIGFLAGILAPGGVLHVEFDHALSMIEGLQFDVIRHGHFTYLSLLALVPALGRHGLEVRDATRTSTYGGAIQALIRHQDDPTPGSSDRVAAILDAERAAGLDSERAYRVFAGRVEALQRELHDFLTKVRQDGDQVAGYGAPSRAVTLLRSSRVTAALLPYTVDRSIAKQGRFVPGTAIRIDAPSRLMKERPRFVLILGWNLADEVMAQLRDVRSWGGSFVIPVPGLQVL